MTTLRAQSRLMFGRRLIHGQFEWGRDVVALRRLVRLSQSQFANGEGISVHTSANWDQHGAKPDGVALGLLRTAARHPRILRENLESTATSCASCSARMVPGRSWMVVSTFW